ncbi:uncharacterized protein [Lolium perenne]|uniref:uncharacterized protein n=1 Tax=Lolium perenne TaxID=4522 RepID=UPI0021F5400D|nr:uncharacterized protein LOC127298269 [Lolium perenne]
MALIAVGMKGGVEVLHMFGGTNAGMLCRRTSYVPLSTTARSSFTTCALVHRNNSSIRSRGSDLGFTGAICTIGSHYPTKGNWGCKAKPATLNLALAINIIYFLVLVSLILWKKIRAKKLMSQLALLLLSLCICLAVFAAKGNKMAICAVTLFDKAGKIYKVLGHLLSILGAPL